MSSKLLMKAIKEHNMAKVKEFSHYKDSKTWINTVFLDDPNYTMLNTAIDLQLTDVTAVLLECQADVNLLGQSMRSPLIRATAMGSHEIMRQLIKYKADIHHLSSSREPSIVYAVNNGDVEGVKMLLDAGADINDNLLWLASKQPFELFRMVLLHPRCPPDEVDYPSLLIHATSSNQIDSVKYLLANHGYSQDILDDALLDAALYGLVELMRILLEAGADVDAPVGCFSIRPLYQAVISMSKNVEAVRLLIDNNADVNVYYYVEDHEGNALDFALDYGFQAAADLLLEAGVSPSPFWS